MGLYGWRLIGVTGTILVYVAGIIFLSVSNIPGPHHPKRIRVSRFGELPKIQPHELMSINRRTQILWCKELKFLDGIPNLPAEAQKEFVVSKPYFKHNSKKAFKINRKDSNNNGDSNNINQLPKPRPSTIQQSDFRNGTTNSTVNNHSHNHKKDEAGLLIALASFPGSGNTWLRYLLQQSTGILTGSIYKDYGLLKSGFPAENICNASVLVVKTHEWGPKALGTFDKAILLVRDPDKAILAEFNRQSGGHVGFASPDRYKRIKGRYWQQFVRNKLNGWEEMNLDWAKNFTGDLKIVFYDDLVRDVEGTLRDILHFINYKIDEALLNCALLRKEGIFRRKKRPLTFDPYTPMMHKSIEETKERVYKLLGKS